MIKCAMFRPASILFAFLFCITAAANAFGNDHPIKKSRLDLPPNISEDLTIRVSLGKDKQKVLVSTPSPYLVLDGENRLLFRGETMAKTPLTAENGRVFLGRQSFRRLPLILDSSKGSFSVDQRQYRDRLEFSVTPDGKLQIINALNLEDYLRGVLPWEANPKWNPEALKAQAVVSRTYALFKMIENRKESYAVSSDVISQVYAGMTLEKESTNDAIDETRGEILVEGGKIFPGFFHSTCGGATTRAENAWPIESHPSLRGGSCGFCNESPHYRWKASFTRAEITAALKKMGHTVKDIKGWEIKDKDEHGRARFFVIEHSAGKLKIPANDFRLALSPMKLKSVLIQRITPQADSFELTGRGWGHGVGLCQYGTKKMAELGYNYRQILEYYYPGSELTVILETGNKA